MSEDAPAEGADSAAKNPPTKNGDDNLTAENPAPLPIPAAVQREIEESIPGDLQPKVQAIAEELVEITAFMGPIPPPPVLRAYAQIDPSFADRALTMAEEKHRHGIECERELIKQHQKAIGAEIADQKADRHERRVGQFCALSIGIFAILSGSLVAVYGGGWEGGFTGSVIGGGGIYGLVKVFILGREERLPVEEPPGNED